MNNKTLKDLNDGFRDKNSILALANEIKKLALNLNQDIYIMEVCGGHTHTIMKFGIDKLLPKSISFIHGPGCPVCIMPKSKIDEAIELAQMPDVILATLGDLVKVRGTNFSLLDIRAKGADVRIVYSPLDIVKIATDNPSKKVIYFAIGFETTTPMSASLIDKIVKSKISNLFLNINHVSVPEPLEMILNSDDIKVNAILAPSHVSVITGAKIYQSIFDKFKLPIVVGGFEPVDVLQSVLMIVKQFVANEPKLEIEYSRCVNYEGNIKAQNLIEQYFTKCDYEFRGLGIVKNGGLKLRDEFAFLNSPTLDIPKSKEHKECICGEILRGVKKPNECKLFGKICTPKNPYGSCMVSSEGACNAYFRYGDVEIG